jgi:RNA polymerase I-specific transcription-initiation factor
MADTDQTRRVEHGREGQNLTYGQYGPAIYDHQQTHSWKFLRTDHRNDSAVGVGDAQHAFHHASKFCLLHQSKVTEGRKEHNENTISPSVRHVQRLGGALRRQSDLALALPVLLHDESDFQIRSHEQVPSLTGAQLVCGHIIAVNSHNQPVEYGGLQILAWVAGIADEQLWTTRTKPCSVLVTQEQAVETGLHIHSAPSNALHDLSLSCESILQICLLRHTSTDLLLGIRKATSIVVLRPIWSWNSQEATLLPASDHSSVAMSLRWHRVLVLPISRTGGHPNSHLAFDGTNDGRLAIIDTQGSWSIWELSGKASRSARVLHKAHLKASGQLPADQSRAKYYDGWHRVCWLHDDVTAQTVLLVCNRGFAEAYNLKGESLGQVDLRLGRRTAGNSVLDVQPCAIQKRACIFLTSTRILVMRLEDKESQEPLELICSWSHYRGAGDLTLRMAMADLDDDREMPKTTAMHVALYSKRSKEVTLYVLAIEDQDGAWKLSASDSNPFPVPAEWHKQRQPFSDLTFTVASKGQRLIGDDDGMPRRLLTLFARMDDGSLLEAVYEYVSRGESGANAESCSPGKDALPGTRRFVRSSKYVDEDDDMDDFVVSDTSEEITGLAPWQRPRKEQHFRRAEIPPGRVKHWTDVLTNTSVDAADVDFMSQMDEKGQLKIMEETENYSRSRTLADYMRGVVVDDIEEASEAAAAWLQQDRKEAGEGGDFEHIILPNPIHASGRRTMLERYMELIESYVGAIPDDTPDRIRVNIERTSRQVALEAFLAGFVWRGRDKDNDSLPAGLPTGDMKPGDEINLGKVAPTPGATDTHTQDNALSHLSKYTTIQKFTPAASKTSAISEILEHLPTDISSDPSEYSFKDTELSLTIAKNEVDASLDPHMKHRAEKPAREERKNLERTRRLREEMALRTLPDRVMSSQLPQPDSTQSQYVQGLPMTQPERGVHGGRDGMKKKGPRRQAGF